MLFFPPLLPHVIELQRHPRAHGPLQQRHEPLRRPQRPSRRRAAAARRIAAKKKKKIHSSSTVEQRHSNFDFDELRQPNLRTDRHEI